jgi:Type II site-specific deoxyribonuclease
MNLQLDRSKRIIAIIKTLPESKLVWIEQVAKVLSTSSKFTLINETFLTSEWVTAFGDGLLIHHAFSDEPFTKDKFEHSMVQTAKIIGLKADFASKGNRGHDITIGSTKISLKTQADKNIKNETLWISKYMELGKGEWSDKLEQLESLTAMFLEHLKESEKILVLRCLGKGPIWHYELVEIPKSILEKSQSGKFEMKFDSRQNPKPGYCHVKNENSELDFQLYFDGGSERKLQIKNLRKSLCIVHAEWYFELNSLNEL